MLFINQKSSNLGINFQYSLKLYAIKLKQIYSQVANGGGSDKEETQLTPIDLNGKIWFVTGMKYEVIKELHLHVESTAKHKVTTSKSKSAR